MPLTRPRPKLTADNVVDYLDWVSDNATNFLPVALDTHMKAAELAVRTLTTEAQGKATQHTLVEDGIIKPPPQAS